MAFAEAILFVYDAQPTDDEIGCQDQHEKQAQDEVVIHPDATMDNTKLSSSKFEYGFFTFQSSGVLQCTRPNIARF